MSKRKKFVELFVTFFYIGRIKYCPGTFGSLAAFPLCYLIVYLSITNQLIFSFTNFTTLQAQFITLFIITLLICLLLFILGTYFSSIYIQYGTQDDPKEVVIDEVVGQMLTIILSCFSVVFVNYSGLTKYLSSQLINFIFLFALPLVLFRFFDIIKPWPINWLDANIKGGIGIMVDDIAAAIFASVMHYAITFTLINWFG
ncbi:phosphatidylglycerophosphatase A [Candidatus Tisiphia endosymbiont of Ditula angustiorana]|uniref:phosphatidylglycerophosphatase A family protein n=1 Tax=Candidatus Tisiphia endosymbiont of Ditula angustiorana TaxID=3066272 RepID=UPI00312C7289